MVSEADRSLAPSPIKEVPNFALTLQTVTNSEKAKGKEIETEMQKYTEKNKEYENNLNNKMKSLSLEIETIQELITKAKSEILIQNNTKTKAEKEYEERMNEITTKETKHTLSMHSVKGRKRHEVPEEKDYFIIKETLRKTKRELHAGFIETIEKLQNGLDKSQHSLDVYQEHKRTCQKELKDLQESLINFYCRNLKDGMDLRPDGIRWTIKALWTMKQPVPISSFPRYLDDESAHFLLTMAGKDLEIEILRKRLDELREEIKKERLTNFSKTPVQLYEIVKDRLKEIKKSSKGVNESFLAENSVFDERSFRYDEIKTCKNTLKNEENNIATLTLDEVKRVVATYNPDNNHGVGLLHIIKTLVGDKHRDFRKFARLKTVKKE